MLYQEERRERHCHQAEHRPSPEWRPQSSPRVCAVDYRSVHRQPNLSRWARCISHVPAKSWHAIEESPLWTDTTKTIDENSRLIYRGIHFEIPFWRFLCRRRQGEGLCHVLQPVARLRPCCRPSWRPVQWDQVAFREALEGWSHRYVDTLARSTDEVRHRGNVCEFPIDGYHQAMSVVTYHCKLIVEKRLPILSACSIRRGGIWQKTK